MKKKARIERGVYLCAGYNRKPHRVKASIKVANKRYNNAVVDHIDPVIDPIKGFLSWDNVIERLFCEEEGLQVLCYECHKQKTNEEKEKKKHGK